MESRKEVNLEQGLELRNVILTGATGMIGLALIDELIARKVFVTAVYRPDSRRLCSIPKHPLVETVACELSDLARLSDRLTRSYDAFFHLGWDGSVGAAARNDIDIQNRNILYSLDAVYAAAKLHCKVFIGAGSQAEYGRVDGILRVDTACSPETAYGAAKHRASDMTRIECEKLGLRQCWARILSVYGPGDADGTLIMTLIRSFLSQQIPACTLGDQLWDYLYCIDAARALLAIAEYGRHGTKYPLGSGTSRPLREYICAVRDAIDPNLPIRFGELPYSDQQIMHLCADLTELTEETGFVPKISFEEGIRRTIANVQTGRQVQ